MKITKTKIFLLVCFLAFFNFSKAQNFVWAKNVSASTNSTGIITWKIVLDANGNSYSIGNIYGTADFDPGPSVYNLSGNINGQDVFIQKLDANGNFVWAKLLSSNNSYSSVSAIKLDNNNNIYVVGSFDDIVDFDPSATTNNITPQGDQDAFILKLDNSGNFQWVKTFGGPTSYTEGMSLVIDNNNNINFTGNYNDIIDIDPNASTLSLSSPNFNTQSFIAQLNSNGNLNWAKVLETSTGNNRSYTIDVDANNNIYCVGSFMGDIDLDPSSNTNMFNSLNFSTDVFVTKFSSNGTSMFGKTFGGNNEDEIMDLKIDNQSNIILGGYFEYTADFDPGSGITNLTSYSSSYDCFISKLDSIGKFIWVKQLGGNGDDELLGLDIDNIGYIYTTGIFEGTADFDPSTATYNLISNGDYDAFVLKLNNNGSFVNAHSLGNSDIDGGTNIAISNNYEIYGTGIFNSNVDFDPSTNTSNLTTTTPSDNGDIYYFKWSQCIPTTNTINATGCSYTLNNQTYSGNGTYTQYFTNSSGCDSVITINLTGSSTNTILNPIVCGTTYTYNGQTYSTSGTYTQNYLNVLGCDSNTIINLTVGTTTNSTMNITACDFYFFNNNWYSTSGQYSDTIINSTGCDSIINLDLTINNSTYDYIIANSCGPYTFNGITYNATGLFSTYLTTVNGCDSTIDLDLTITPIPPTTLNQSSCGAYTLNGQTYTSSGTYSQIITTAQGCDSTIILNLTVNNPNINVTQTGAILTSSQSAPATYQWIKCNPFTIISGANSQSYTATANGDYAVIVTLNSCSDTSVCKTVNGLSINNYFSNSSSLYPNPVDNILNIDFNKMIDFLNIKISSMTGQIVFESEYHNTNSIHVPTLNLSKGIYLIHLNDGKEKGILKFTKD